MNKAVQGSGKEQSNLRLALPKDIWACPACDQGWQQYIIATDQNACSKCGYTGGDPEKWRKLVEAVRQEAKTA